MDEFEDEGSVARPPKTPMTPTADGNATACKRPEPASSVTRVDCAANDTLRSDMMTQLSWPLGIAGLVAVASRAFAGLVRCDGRVR